MTFTFGQLASTSDPEKWKDNGDSSTTLNGKLLLANYAGALTTRQQLLGYLKNPAEKHIAIASTVDAARTGFYRVTGISADTPADIVSGFLPFDASLERVQGASYPLVEMMTSGADRRGIPAGVVAVPWHAVPATWSGYDGNQSGGPIGLFLRSGAGANVWFFSGTNYYGTGGVPWIVNAGAAPANFYDAPVQFKSSGNLSIGRQIISDPTSWELNNTFVRVQPDNTGSNLIKIAVNAGAGWSTDVSFKFTSDNGATFWPGPPRSVTILRNGPERIAVRLAVPVNGFFAVGVYYVDLTLRRGSRYVQGMVTSTWSTRWGIQFAGGNPIATVDANGGARMTTATISGHSFLIASGGAGTLPTWTNAAGRCALAAAGTRFDFALGAEINTAGPAAAPDRGIDLRDQYFGAVTEQQWMVAQ